MLSSAAAALAGGLALVGLAEAAGYAIWPNGAGLAAALGFATATMIGVSAARQDGAAWPLTVAFSASLVALVASVGIGTAPLSNPVLAGGSLAFLAAMVLPAAGLVAIVAYAGTRALTELTEPFPDRS